MNKLGTYKIKKFSKIRQALSEFYEISTKRTSMIGLVELNVDKARKLIGILENDIGIKLSFTGWLIKCIGQAVSENKEVQAYRLKKDELIVFDNVHVSIMVERTTSSGNRIPINYVINSANKKTVLEITKEIRKIQNSTVDEENQIVEGTPESYLKLYSLVPKFVRKCVIRKKMRDTLFVIENAGTVAITALGMFGKNIAGWPIPFPTNTLNIAVGGIKRKPVLIEGKLEEHEILNLTIQIDHNIVDGAPATRFVSKLAKLVEEGYGLES